LLIRICHHLPTQSSHSRTWNGYLERWQKPILVQYAHHVIRHARNQKTASETSFPDAMYPSLPGKHADVTQSSRPCSTATFFFVPKKHLKKRRMTTTLQNKGSDNSCNPSPRRSNKGEKTEDLLAQ
jgi:hypothetical protein